jgi:hypothetical protein
MFQEVWLHAKKPRSKQFAIGAFAAMMFAQVYGILLFFPHLAFYGAQYGERFVGDLYGPAVTAFQGTENLYQELVKIKDKSEPVLFPYGATFWGKGGVYFNRRDPLLNYHYALDTIYDGHHLHKFDEEAYRNWLKTYCTPYWSLDYPLEYQIFTLYECRDQHIDGN